MPIALNGTIYRADSVLVDGLRYRCTTGLDVDQQRITVSARPSDTIGGVPFLVALREGVFDGCTVRRDRAFLTAWDAPPIGGVTLFHRAPGERRSGRADVRGPDGGERADAARRRPAAQRLAADLQSHALRHRLPARPAGLRLGRGGRRWGEHDVHPLGRRERGADTGHGDVHVGRQHRGVSHNQAGGRDRSDPHLSAAGAAGPGDSFTAYQGCDHTLATCRSKFANEANFRGFPFVPTPEAAF